MSQLAQVLGEKEDVDRYRTLAQKGQAFCDRTLWNGRYYVQKVQVKGLRASQQLPEWMDGYSEEAQQLLKREGPKYQYGSGCLSDGVIGQWYTTMLGLPDALDRKHTRQHLQAIFQHNFRNSLRGHANPQRPGYALNDEPGLLLCSWPAGGKPSLPFPYSDEVWTGIEYQVASHLIWEGQVEEGLTIVRAVRARYDGRVRNPWNEYECGSYYARALSSYALLLALSGFRYSAAARRLELAPRMAGSKGRFLFSVDSGWGSIHYQKQGRKIQIRIEVEEGQLEVQEVCLGGSVARRPVRQRLGEVRMARPGRDVVVAF